MLIEEDPSSIERNNMEYNKNPISIEEESFKIIGQEAGAVLDRFSEEELMIVKRLIHTTADFEYADLIEFHPDAIDVAKKALRNHCTIYADTSMIVNGVSHKKQNDYGFKIINYVHDDDVYKLAEEQSITRSMAGLVKAVNNKIRIYAIGNAPTAIFQLKELMDQGLEKPDLIIGMPVGFVGAAESKALLSQLDLPYIRVNGRKGGSALVVATINALLKML